MRRLVPTCALLVTVTACDPSASTGKPCSTDDQCAPDAHCVNGSCAGPTACTRDAQCGDGQVCGQAGLCESQEVLPETCASHADCPLRAYCNISLEAPTCILLMPGACRDASQCAGQACSALPDGVGRCASSGVDAGPGIDAGGANDPSCGGDSQRCCGSGAAQPTACDSSNLVCLPAFPGPSDAYCWRRCSAVACTTLEGNSGTCHVSSTGQGSCQGEQAWTCSDSSECQQLGPSGQCVYMDYVNAYCFAMGCNWQADCASGYYCSTYDGNLCLDVSMLGG